MQGEVEPEGPSESECRPYIEKALKELETGETVDTGTLGTGDSQEDIPTVEITTDDSGHQEGDGEHDTTNEAGKESAETDQNTEEQQSGQDVSLTRLNPYICQSCSRILRKKVLKERTLKKQKAPNMG